MPTTEITRRIYLWHCYKSGKHSHSLLIASVTFSTRESKHSSNSKRALKLLFRTEANFSPTFPPVLAFASQQTRKTHLSLPKPNDFQHQPLCLPLCLWRSHLHLPPISFPTLLSLSLRLSLSLSLFLWLVGASRRAVGRVGMCTPHHTRLHSRVRIASCRIPKIIRPLVCEMSSAVEDAWRNGEIVEQAEGQAQPEWVDIFRRRIGDFCWCSKGGTRGCESADIRRGERDALIRR